MVVRRHYMNTAKNLVVDVSTKRYKVGSAGATVPTYWSWGRLVHGLLEASTRNDFYFSP